jgi:hypothetical protein
MVPVTYSLYLEFYESTGNFVAAMLSPLFPLPTRLHVEKRRQMGRVLARKNKMLFRSVFSLII